MTREKFDKICAELTSTTHVVQWGGASVWKVGGKIFAICSNWGEGQRDAISFKCSELSFRILTELPGVVPAPYLARASWVQVRDASTLDEEDLAAHIAEAHRLVASRLTRARRAELGLA
uniref:MmcQ/YjbR family DNA-binding protein n=1 Tax=Stappia sp. TaxID=1870903 RepID=UPI003BAC91D5